MELGKYGMFSLGLDRPEYVLAGALWVFLSVIPILIFRAWMTLVSTPESIKDVRAIGKMLPSILAGYVAFSYFLGILSDYELRVFSIHGLVAMLFVVGNSFMLANEYSQTFKPLRGQRIFTLLESQPRLAYKVALSSVSILSFLFLYSIIVYPYFPIKYGGGSHPKIELFLSEQLNVPWSTYDIPLAGDGLKIGPVRLLLETEDTIVFARSAERDALGFLVSTPAYALSKKNIATCRFIPRYTEEKASGSDQRQTKQGSVATVDEPEEGMSTPILPPGAAVTH